MREVKTKIGNQELVVNLSDDLILELSKLNISLEDYIKRVMFAVENELIKVTEKDYFEIPTLVIIPASKNKIENSVEGKCEKCNVKVFVSNELAKRYPFARVFCSDCYLKLC